MVRPPSLLLYYETTWLPLRSLVRLRVHCVTKFAVKSLEDRPNYSAPTIDLFYNIANCIFRHEEVLLADGGARLDTVETLRGFYE